MTAAFRYLENVYLSELDLYRAERVTADEAEPIELPDPLPRILLVVSGGDAFADDATATAAFEEADARDVAAAAEMGDWPHGCPHARLVTLRLDASGRRYEPAGCEITAV